MPWTGQTLAGSAATSHTPHMKGRKTVMDSRDVETYYDGARKNRRPGAEPFSSDGPRVRQLAIGAEVARWAQAH